MRYLLAALAIALIAATAYAQDVSVAGVPKVGGGEKKAAQNEMKKRENAESEKAYKKALSTLPDKPYDPWGSVRP